jgi:hypothetical protein
MQRFLRPLTALACCMLLLAGCQDKHAPVKPTVAIAATA